MVKRFFDLFLVIPGLFLLLPVFIIIAAWIKLGSKGSVMFRQERIGLNGEPFRIHKFRTMVQDSEYLGKLTVGADPRITTVGHFLRRYKLDELPQLIDVFRGKMSLVGPRPEVKKYIDCYPDEVRQKILSVRPGITDRASIEMINENELLGRSETPEKTYIEEILPIKQKYYLEYVENRTLLGDLSIIFQTLARIIS